jgi:hypothetical protein
MSAFIDKLGHFTNPQQGMYYQPDHWQHFVFRNGQARNPIVGIRAEDAIAFCRWLTQQEGGRMVFRLPEAKEVEQFPLEEASVGSWCTRDGETVLSDLSGLTIQEIKNSLVTLSDLPFPSSLSLRFNLDELRSILGNNSEINQRLMLDLEYALDISRALSKKTFDITRPIALSRIRALHHHLSIARDLTGKVVSDDCINKGSEIGQSLEYILAIIRALDYDVVLDSNRDRDTFIMRDHNRESGIDRRLGLEVLLEQSRAFASEIVLNFFFYCLHICNCKYVPPKIRELYTCRILDIDIAREVALWSTQHDIVAMLERNDLAEANRLANSSQRHPDMDIARYATLLSCLLAVPRSDLFLKARKVQRRFVSNVLRCAYVSKKDTQRDSSGLEGTARFQTNEFNELRNNPDYALLDLYWWLQIILAREDGKLTAYEGIRIVREQVQV